MNKEAKAKMQAAVDHLHEELKTVRTGRANAALVENVDVVYYDQHMPVKALANITTPDAKSITITPWDANSTAAIEKALHEDKNLQLNPLSDGKSIHIQVPPPTADRRQQLVRQVSEIAEETHISLRNARHEALKDAQVQLKAKELSENEFDSIKKDLDALVADFGGEIDKVADAKKQEVVQV
ncbi:MAG: ribosome recycling factor [Candidatus Saccharimonadales bacterium]